MDGSQGDLRALGHPQRPRQAQPWGVQQVPFISNKNEHLSRGSYTLFSSIILFFIVSESEEARQVANQSTRSAF